MKIKKAQVSTKEDEILFRSIKTAHSEMEQAACYFNELTDHAAVDFASYNLLAARAKYTYLMKLAKKKNLSLDDRRSL